MRWLFEHAGGGQETSIILIVALCTVIQNPKKLCSNQVMMQYNFWE